MLDKKLALLLTARMVLLSKVGRLIKELYTKLRKLLLVIPDVVELLCELNDCVEGL